VSIKVNKKGSLERFFWKKLTMNTSNDDNAAPEPKRSFDRMEEAARKASEKAREAAPKVKEAFEEIFSDVAYGLAYGSSFAGTFVNEFVPESVKSSVAKGAEEGRKAANEASASVREAVDKWLPFKQSTNFLGLIMCMYGERPLGN